MKTLQLTYLYPHHMNLYGDTGNIICLLKRAQWRGISLNIVPINPGDSLERGKTDIYFFGGGQDAQQEYISKDLLRLKETISDDISQGTPALTICGGYQLFGSYFKTKDQHIIDGIGVFDLYTQGSDHRMIGNCIVELEGQLHQQIKQVYGPTSPDTLVGFENHSGETFIQSNTAIGVTKIGYGNNYTQKIEGYWYQNAFGTYLHGSLLPKNPHLADYLLSKALEKRYDQIPILQPLDDTTAWQAHRAISDRYGLANQ